MCERKKQNALIKYQWQYSKLISVQNTHFIFVHFKTEILQYWSWPHYYHTVYFLKKSCGVPYLISSLLTCFLSSCSINWKNKKKQWFIFSPRQWVWWKYHSIIPKRVFFQKSTTLKAKILFCACKYLWLQKIMSHGSHLPLKDVLFIHTHEEPTHIQLLTIYLSFFSSAPLNSHIFLSECDVKILFKFLLSAFALQIKTSALAVVGGNTYPSV